MYFFYQLLKLVQGGERKPKSGRMASNVSCLLKLHIFEAGMTSHFPEASSFCTVSNLAHAHLLFYGRLSQCSHISSQQQGHRSNFPPALPIWTLHVVTPPCAIISGTLVSSHPLKACVSRLTGNSNIEKWVWTSLCLSALAPQRKVDTSWV